jgi:hypothetical protein
MRAFPRTAQHETIFLSAEAFGDNAAVILVPILPLSVVGDVGNSPSYCPL